MILLLCLACGIVAVKAYTQTTPKQKSETKDTKTKVKPITTPSDKAHNILHPKRKISHGTKYKHKTPRGKTTTKVKKEN